MGSSRKSFPSPQSPIVVVPKRNTGAAKNSSHCNHSPAATAAPCTAAPKAEGPPEPSMLPAAGMDLVPAFTTLPTSCCTPTLHHSQCNRAAAGLTPHCPLPALGAGTASSKQTVPAGKPCVSPTNCFACLTASRALLACLPACLPARRPSQPAALPPRAQPSPKVHGADSRQAPALLRGSQCICLPTPEPQSRSAQTHSKSPAALRPPSTG